MRATVVLPVLALLTGCAMPPVRGVAPSDHFDGRRFFNPDGVQGSAGEQKQGPAALLRNLVRPPYHTWPRHVPVTPSHPPARVPGSTMRVTWIGHSTVLVQTQGLNILTDPMWAARASPVKFLGVKRVREPGVRLADLPRIDLVLLSHNHRDHLDMTAMRYLWRRDRPTIVTGLGNDALLARHGIRAIARDWGGQVALRPGIAVIVDRAHHWSEYGLGDRDRTLWAGFTVTLPGGNLYFAGDTGAGDMRWATEARRAGPVRLAILPIGAYHFDGNPTDNHIGPDQAVSAFEQLAAAYAIGVHWGTFELTSEAIDEPPEHLRAALVRARIALDRFRTPEAGEAWVID